MTCDSPRPLSHWWSTAWTRALDGLMPPTCAACDATPVRVVPFCPRCHTAESLPESPRITATYGPALVAAAGLYRPPLSTAVLRLKFQGRPDLAGPLSKLVTSLPSPSDGGDVLRPLLVPVPLHPQRLAERGYNPAALLARQWARNGLGQYAGHLLRRTVNTMPQSLTESRQQRQENLANAFRASPIPEKRAVILIDDVVTTGATLANCAHALLAAGARCVSAQVIACTESSRPLSQ